MGGGYGQGSGFGAEGQRGAYSGGMYGSTGYGGQSSQGGSQQGGWGGSSQQGGQFGGQQGGLGMQQQRSQRNRGPKGYTRSDERIREDISEQLMRHHYIDASEVEIQVQGGEVTLTGTVHERRMKHEIEDLVDNVSGVRDVTNNIRVQRQDQHAAGGQSTWMQQSTTGLGQQGGQSSGSHGQQGSAGSSTSSPAGTGTAGAGSATASTAGQSGGEQGKDKDKDAENRSRGRTGSTGS
jgi:hypothetical protein